MKSILVCIKRVVDYNVRVRVKPEQLRRRHRRLEDEHQSVRTRLLSRRHCGSGERGEAEEVVMQHRSGRHAAATANGAGDGC